MSRIQQFREAIGQVDPSDLTVQDRVALMGLVARCLAHNDGGGASPRVYSDALRISRRVSSAVSSSSL